MSSLGLRQAIRRAKRSAAVGQTCWDAPAAIQERVDKLCAGDGFSGKYIAQEIRGIGTNDTVTFRFTAPGAFCPKRMLIFALDDATRVPVDLGISFVKIKVGLENQVLNVGPRSVGMVDGVPAKLFSPENVCCPVFCPPCICAPQVPLTVQFANGSGTDIDVTIVLLGEYVDVPPDQFQFNQPTPDPTCCPPPSSDKLMGFATLLAPGATETIRMTTPGAFCPRQLFFTSLGVNTSFLKIHGIRSGLDETILSGPLPIDLFTIANKCCVLSCIECICMPGYPIEIDIENTHDETPALIAGALVGCFTDACPPGM